jgi:hypothetical protein
MVGAAGPVGHSAEGEDDDVDWAANGAEDRVIGVHDPVCVCYEVFGVLQGVGSQLRVDIDRDRATGADTHLLRVPPVAGPSGPGMGVLVGSEGMAQVDHLR